MTLAKDQDARILITSPDEVEEIPGLSPFDLDHREDLVYCCFFKEIEQRAAFLDSLRSIVTSAGAQGQAERPAEEYARQQRAGASIDAFVTLLRWWTVEMRRGYHAYSLKVGFPALSHELSHRLPRAGRLFRSPQRRARPAADRAGQGPHPRLLRLPRYLVENA